MWKYERRTKKLEGREKKRKNKIHNKGFAQFYFDLVKRNEEKRKIY